VCRIEGVGVRGNPVEDPVVDEEMLIPSGVAPAGTGDECVRVTTSHYRL